MKKKDLTYKNKSGFRTPENYFEELEGRMMQKWAKNPLSEEKISSGFETPLYYFEKFKVALPIEKETKVVPLFSKKVLAYAASIAAMLLLVFTISTKYSVEKASFSSIDDKSMETYIENDNIDFLNPEIQNFITKETNLSELKFNGIEKDALFNYLMENSSELSYMNY